MLVVALCVPEAFDDRALGLTLAAAYGVVRAAHIGLFAIASRDDPQLRRSVTVWRWARSSGVALVALRRSADGWVQGALWAVALLVDMAVPFLFGSEGWHLEPGHFAERHGLIVLIALGESIVALGVGTSVGLTAGVVAAAVLGVALAAAMWWSYFDVGSQLAARRFAETPPGQVQNEMARDAYSLLHFPIVAGVVLVALALEHVLSHVDEPLDTVASVALGGGIALFLFGQIAFKLRMTGILARQRVVPAAGPGPGHPALPGGRRVGVARRRRCRDVAADRLGAAPVPRRAGRDPGPGELPLTPATSRSAGGRAVSRARSGGVRPAVVGCDPRDASWGEP